MNLFQLTLLLVFFFPLAEATASIDNKDFSTEDHHHFARRTQVTIKNFEIDGIGLPLEELDFFAYALRTAFNTCLLYTSPSPRDLSTSRMPSSA